MRLPFFFFLFSCLLSGVLVAPVYRIAWQAPRGPEVTYAQYNDTFAYVGERLGAEFEIYPFALDKDLQAAAGSFDFVFGGPTLLYCVILANNIQPLATLVNTVAGKPVSVLSGSIIVAADSNITTLADLKDRTIAVGQFTGLATFQSQLYFLIMNNISLFTDTKALLGYPSSQAILNAVVTGVADAGFVNTQPLPPDVMVLNAKIFSNQNLPSTTGTYSTQVFAAAKAIPNELRTSVTEALLSVKLIRPDILLAANYSGWGVPQSFIDIRRLGQATGLLSPGGERCTDLTQAYSFIKCPDGYRRIPDTFLGANCARIGYRCPPGVTCICSPCTRIIPPIHVGTLRLPQFIGVMLGILLFCVFVCVVMCLRRKYRVKFIPWDSISVDHEEILGQTSKGLVLKGHYKNRWVACKRAYPRTAVGTSIFDPAKSEASDVAGMNALVHVVGLGECLASFFGIPTRLSRRGQKLTEMASQDHPNILSIIGATRGADGYELVIVSEFAPRGTLQDLLDNKSIDVPPASLLRLGLDTARGLAFLHGLKAPCVGTKLTASSIFVSDSFECKLSPDVTLRTGVLGARRVMLAPEVLRGGQPTMSADMYSFGMLLYHIVHRTEPFADCDVSFVTKGVCDLDADEIIRPMITEKNLPTPINLLMQRCWDDDPDKRPTVQEAVDLLMPYADISLGGQLMMEASQQRALLQQILPDHVLKALQEGRTPSSRTFELVTVFFSDIKGFTNISSTQTPEGVMFMLDDLYRKFDALCNKHNLMKVETIGDAYMLVGGIKVEKDHAARVARFALEAVQAAHTVKLPGGLGSVKIRAGFHSGSVTSGVVGSEVPRYCLFGDTVNVASRMESTGVVDRIQMSAAAAVLVKEQAPELANRIHSRAGLVTPKGKTPMQTFWLFTDDDMNQVRTRGGSGRVKRNSEGGLSQISEGSEETTKRRRSDGVFESGVFGKLTTARSGSDWV